MATLTVNGVELQVLKQPSWAPSQPAGHGHIASVYVDFRGEDIREVD